ncbi:MAG: glycosyltransferase family 4 protein [Pseudomonadota bacterium]
MNQLHSSSAKAEAHYARHPDADRPVRVLFMADHLGHPNGRVHGGTTYFLNTIPALQDAGFEIDAVFLTSPHPAAAQMQARGVRPSFLSLKKYQLGSYATCRRAVNAKPYDVVHLHSVKAHLLGRMAVHALDAATIVHVHDHYTLKQPLKFLQRRLGPTTNALIGVSKVTTAFGREQYNVPAARCVTIYNGIDLMPYRAAADDTTGRVRAELGVPQDHMVIVVAGRLIPSKGQPQLFQALPAVVKDHPQTELWVVGDGEARADYMRLVKDLGITPYVRFLGQRGDMPDIYASANLAVVPSMLQEAFGLVALEASASGIPVVAFDVGGIAEVVRHDRNGVLVPQGDVTALSKAIAQVCSDPNRRANLGAAGRELADDFSLAKHVDRLSQLYRRILSREPLFAPSFS